MGRTRPVTSMSCGARLSTSQRASSSCVERVVHVLVREHLAVLQYRGLELRQMRRVDPAPLGGGEARELGPGRLRGGGVLVDPMLHRVDGGGRTIQRSLAFDDLPLGLGANIPIATGTNDESLFALQPSTGKVTRLHVPYPMGFYHRGVDGRATARVQRHQPADGQSPSHFWHHGRTGRKVGAHQHQHQDTDGKSERDCRAFQNITITAAKGPTRPHPQRVQIAVPLVTQ